jgi:2-polyprenyl-3-methyl-5-hydroxy-6-metoxy-1,4-benzoquinol methylase
MGAKSVTAIDIDASKFPKDQQGVKFIHSSLQEYAWENYAHQYHAITVFLWCIPLADWSYFLRCCKRILAPDGHLFIGVHEDILGSFKSATNLHYPLWNAGFNCPMEKFETNAWNRYLFCCKHR